MPSRAAVLVFAAALLLPALASCASYDPHDRIVRARFLCTDGRRLRVQFRLDRHDALIAGDGMKRPVVLPATGAERGRSYAGLAEGGGYSLSGLGDRIDWASPGASAVTCDETH